MEPDPEAEARLMTFRAAVVERAPELEDAVLDTLDGAAGARGSAELHYVVGRGRPRRPVRDVAMLWTCKTCGHTHDSLPMCFGAEAPWRLLGVAETELAIHEIIDDLSPRHALSRVSDADCVVTMMLNVFCGRVALFRMDEWLGRTDGELLLGAGRDADAFDDNRLAAALDHIDAIGTDRLLTAVVK